MTEEEVLKQEEVLKEEKEQEEEKEQDIKEEEEEEQNDVPLEELNYIREKIEEMNHFNQVEVLRILNSYEYIQLNENKYGIHINLTCLKKEVIDKIKLYINYVNKQESTLDEVEKQKENFKNTYFKKNIELSI